MPIFQYKANDINRGKVAKGNIVALNEGGARNKLKRRRLDPVKVVNVTNSLQTKLLLFINRVKVKDLVVFSRQFSVMISANVTVVDSLLTLIDQTENITLQNIISEIAYEVDSGALLSDALAKRNKVFSTFYINIVHSGETSGKLDEVLLYLADEMEKDYDMINKFRSAMIYPVFIICGLVVVAIILMNYVIPNLTEILEETGATLPLATRIVISFVDFFQAYILLIILVVAALIGAFYFWLKTERGRYRFDYMTIKIPVLGTLFRYIYLVRFSRSLSTMLKGGIIITQALKVSSSIVRNKVYEKLILDTLKSINEGESITEVFNQSPVVPKMVPQMMNVGEKTGKLDEVLDKITEFYNREINNMLVNLTAIIEPAIMVIMGIGVGIMVAAIILPMYNIASQF